MPVEKNLILQNRIDDVFNSNTNLPQKKVKLKTLIKNVSPWYPSTYVYLLEILTEITVKLEFKERDIYSDVFKTLAKAASDIDFSEDIESILKSFDSLWSLHYDVFKDPLNAFYQNLQNTIVKILHEAKLDESLLSDWVGKLAKATTSNYRDDRLLQATFDAIILSKSINSPKYLSLVWQNAMRFIEQLVYDDQQSLMYYFMSVVSDISTRKTDAQFLLDDLVRIMGAIDGKLLEFLQINIDDGLKHLLNRSQYLIKKCDGKAFSRTLGDFEVLNIFLTGTAQIFQYNKAPASIDMMILLIPIIENLHKTASTKLHKDTMHAIALQMLLIIDDAYLKKNNKFNDQLTETINQYVLRLLQLVDQRWVDDQHLGCYVNLFLLKSVDDSKLKTPLSRYVRHVSIHLKETQETIAAFKILSLCSWHKFTVQDKKVIRESLNFLAHHMPKIYDNKKRINLVEQLHDTLTAWQMHNTDLDKKIKPVINKILAKQDQDFFIKNIDKLKIYAKEEKKLKQTRTEEKTEEKQKEAYDSDDDYSLSNT